MDTNIRPTTQLCNPGRQGDHNDAYVQFLCGRWCPFDFSKSI